MKKNVMMRMASCLLVAVLLTTCVISGTFAKYTTTSNASDEARVAKWGVTVTVTGSAFAKSYTATETVQDTDGNTITSTVSSTTDNLVVPGTNGKFTGVAITGTPEVAVKIEKTATLTLTGWEINVDGTNTFYCPIVITVNGTDIKGTDYTSATNFATAVEEAIESASANYAPNTDLSKITGLNGDYEWNWAFSGTDTDAKDTALGNLSTSPTIKLEVAATVTQID